MDDPRAIDIASAAEHLNDLRENWLNPVDLVERISEVVPGFPDRIVPVSPKAAEILKKRTLTNLYNERPAWLDNTHRDLDVTVAAAYGWPPDISEGDALARLLDLNRVRAQRGASSRRERRPTPEQLRREPELPPMRITGGRKTDQEQPLPLEEPLLSFLQPLRRRRSRS
jgi:hypothetical protein